MEAPFRCGFVAVVGRPNVGKSTLINALVGTKVSIVTPKPQTTRHRIVGVANRPGAQILFVDTPGLHDRTGKAINRLMNRTAITAVNDADVVLWVSEAGRFGDEDAGVLRQLAQVRSPLLAVLNKIDRLHPRERLLQAIEATAARASFADIVPVSAATGSNLDRLAEVIAGHLPESPPLYPEDQVSDRGEAFRAAELIREKLTEALHDELPYGLTVQVEQFVDEDSGIRIDAVIYVERESQKGIVVGRGGRQLKATGRAARVELREWLGRAVHLSLWVKVRNNWADSDGDLQRFGFDSP